MILPKDKETKEEYVSRCLSSKQAKEQFPNVQERMQAYIDFYRVIQKGGGLD